MILSCIPEASAEDHGTAPSTAAAAAVSVEDPRALLLVLLYPARVELRVYTQAYVYFPSNSFERALVLLTSLAELVIHIFSLSIAFPDDYTGSCPRSWCCTFDGSRSGCYHDGGLFCDSPATV